jgi:hypothetical protein
MGDPFASQNDTASGFGRKGALITPGNTDLPNVAKGIVCLQAGNVTIVPPENADGATLPFLDCPVGFTPPYQVRRVTAATGVWATIED